MSRAAKGSYKDKKGIWRWVANDKPVYMTPERREEVRQGLIRDGLLSPNEGKKKK